MSSLLRIELEGLPPSVNQMYRTNRRGSRYKRVEVSLWQSEISEMINEAWGNKPPYTGNVEVHIVFTVKGNRRWDIDNRLKSLIDCLQEGGAIKDDSQIWGIVAYRERGEKDSTELVMMEHTEIYRK